MSRYVDKIKMLSGNNYTDELMARALDGMKAVIELSGDDVNRDGLLDSPHRVVKAFLEYTQGYKEEPINHLKKTFEVQHKDLVLVKDISFTSLCEHHFAPFFGVAHVGYIPNEKVTGLSKLARLVDGFAQRFQVQEHLTQQIADAIEAELQPLGVVVVIEAKHTCMCYRGVGKETANTVTSTLRGVFLEEPATRAEAMALINARR